MKSKKPLLAAAVALAAVFSAIAGEGDVLARFYGENVGKALRRIPSWVVPENAFVGLSNSDFEDESGATQKRIFDAYRDRSDWDVITYTLVVRCADEAAFLARLTDMSEGTVSPLRYEEMYLAWPEEGAP